MLKHVRMSFDKFAAQPPFNISPLFLSQTFSVTPHGNSYIKAIAIFTYNDLPLPKGYYTRETMILNKLLCSEYTRNGFRGLMPPGDPRNPCASHVKKRGPGKLEFIQFPSFTYFKAATLATKQSPL